MLFASFPEEYPPKSLSADLIHKDTDYRRLVAFTPSILWL